MALYWVALYGHKAAAGLLVDCLWSLETVVEFRTYQSCIARTI